MIAERRLPHRNISPPSRVVWPHCSRNKTAQFEAGFADWLKALSDFEETAQSRLYENPEPHPFEFRCHRAALGGLIHDGENLVLAAYGLLEDRLIEEDKATRYVALLDGHLDTLTSRMKTWHTPPDEQEIPDSFKAGIEDFTEGRIVPLSKALSETPPNLPEARQG